MRNLSAATFLRPRCPPTKLPLIPLEELWEFVEETRGLRDRALSEESTGQPTLLARRLGSMRMSESESGTSWGHSW
ncbi:hypothetical protein chiPu_0004111 [Chiloscyllium punctatum]|uniref:Uncharacterized protein n=1 Tax=Chiloscyllium punctatum TaxID=137246 RepID=A0A401S5M2_CHIPU|nr:hypothetical protein [Chiloscyllium punctatum]